MSITVKTFNVSNDRKTINVDLEAGAGKIFTGFLLWDENTYKDPATAVDLSYKLAGANNIETFTITAEEAGLGSFEGIHIAEIVSDDPDAIVVATASLLKYYVVLASLLANIDLSCLSCNANFNNSLLLDMYIEAMKQALLLGRFQDAIGHLKKIKIFTEDVCGTCVDLVPVVSSAGNIVSIGIIDCILATT